MKQKLLLVVLTMCVCGTTVFGQKSLRRDLKTEDDGFQYYSTKSNGKYGAEDKNKKTLIPISRGYSNVWYYNGWFYVRRNGAAGACDISGKEIIAPDKYSRVVFIPEEGHTGWFSVDRNGAAGACDISGKEIIAPNKYSSVVFRPVEGHTGWFSVEIDGEKGACDMTGREIIPCKFKKLTFNDKCFQYENSAGDWIKLDIKLDVLGKAYGSDIGLSSSPSSSRSSYSSSSSSTSSSNNSGNNTTTIVVEQQHIPQAFQEWQQCTSCWGSGNCRNCAGSGTNYVGSNLHRCSMCGGSGRCTTCSGKGGQNIIVYR